MEPDEYCQEKAAETGSSLYYSTLFLPEQQRRALTALHAFQREVEEIVREVSESGAARLKLAWWHAEVDRLYTGQPGHPIARALAPFVETLGLSREHFQEIISGVDMDIDHGGFEHFEELEAHCNSVACGVALLSAEILGYNDPRTLNHARELGMALRLTEMLYDVRLDAMRGRVYIPSTDLDAYGVKPGELAQPSTPDHVRNLFEYQAQRARQYYANALANLPAEDRHAQRGGLVLARLYMALLDEIERDGFRLLEHRLELTPLRKLWIAWRTVRAEERLRRRAARAA